MSTEIDHALHELMADINVLYEGINKNVLSSFGMRRVRYHAMRHLFLKPGLTLSQLRELTLVDRASLSRMVFSMEKDGLIQRTLNKEDRRLFKLHLSQQGLRLYTEVQAAMDNDIQKRFQALNEQAKSKLLEQNKILRDILVKHKDA